MGKVDIGEAAQVEVDARPRWHRSGLWLDAGAIYELSATGTWVDLLESNRCGPDGYRSNTRLLRFFERWRNEPSQPWFALVGAIAMTKHTQFPIGNRCTFRPEASGELTCFANDVPLMRWNNTGSVSLTVTRTG